MSKRITERGFILLALVGLATACNPTVDPAATFTAHGRVVNAAGQGVANAEVRLIRYSSDLNVLEPSTETLFADAPRGDTDLGLDVAVVQTVRTNATGNFSMSFKGADIAKPGGAMTGTGLVEVASTVLVVRDPDPSNSEKRAGVFTLPYLFQQAASDWGAGDLDLWNPEARADTSRALSGGLIELSWKRLGMLDMSTVKNAYRVDIGTQDGNRFILRCSDGGTVVDGGCAPAAGDAMRLVRAVSAYSVFSFYSDSSGMFSAHVEAHGSRLRYVARFTVSAPVPNVRETRDGVGLIGVWAVGREPDQDLKATAATDGNPATRQMITNSATAIYAKLDPARITDAGLLNALVRDAAKGCVVLEFSVSDFPGIAEAKRSDASAWTRKGKFCGENGGRGEVSALAAFETDSQDAIIAGWMRLRAEADAGATGAFVEFLSVGEVAVYKKKGM